MALEVHDTIRLDTALTGNLPTLEFKVKFNAFHDQDYAAAMAERSLTGQLHVHRTTSAGTVLQFQDHEFGLILTSSEYTSLLALVGKVCYYMPHNRDEDDALTYRSIVFFEALGEQSLIDPAMSYYEAAIRLVDADGCTVG